MLRRFAGQLPGLLFCCVLTCACGGSVTAPAPRDPQTPATPVALPVASRWAGHYTVLSSVGSGGCGAGRVPDEQGDVGWLVTYDGSEILLDENIANYPTDDVLFKGAFSESSRDVSASYSQGPMYADSVCQFREATLVGVFNQDVTRMEGTETLVWGEPGNETLVVRKWLLEK